MCTLCSVYYVRTMSILACINPIHQLEVKVCSPRPQGVRGINRWLGRMNAAGFRSSHSRNLASYHGKMAQLLRNGCISKVFSMSSVLPDQNGNFFSTDSLWSLEYIVFFSHISQHVRIWIKCWEGKFSCFDFEENRVIRRLLVWLAQVQKCSTFSSLPPSSARRKIEFT